MDHFSHSRNTPAAPTLPWYRRRLRLLGFFMDRYEYWVLKRPRTISIALLVLFFLALWGAKDFHLDASTDGLLLDNDPDLWTLRQINQRYGSQDFLIVTYSPRSSRGVDSSTDTVSSASSLLFSERELKELGKLEQRILELPTVESVYSMLQAPLLTADATDGTVAWPTLMDRLALLDSARQELTASPLYRDLLVNAAGDTATLIIILKGNELFQQLALARQELLIKRYQTDLDAEQTERLARLETEYQQARRQHETITHTAVVQIRQILASYRKTAEVHLGGLPMISDDVIQYIKGDLIMFGASALVCVTLILICLFRRFIWVLLPLLSCVVGCVYMVGLFGFAGWQVTVISSNCLSLMLIFIMSMNVHLIRRYRELCREVPDALPLQRVSMTVREMFLPCFYTVLTTMVGFGSMVVSDIKPVVDFGWMMVVALAITAVVCFTLFPIVMLLIDGAKPDPAPHHRRGITSFFSFLVERQQLVIFFCTGLFVLFVGVGLTRLSVENSFMNYFSKKSEIYQGLYFIDRNLGGTTPLDILLHLPTTQPAISGSDEDLEAIFGGEESSGEETWFTLDKLQRIRKVHRYLEDLPHTGKVFSYASLLEMWEKHAGQRAGSFEAGLLFKRFPEEARDLFLNPYLSLPHDEARISVRLHDTDPDLDRNKFLATINRDLQEKLGIPKDGYQLAGLAVLYNNMLQSLFRSQILSLGIVFLVIFIMFWMIFRSVKVALIGVVPNILAAMGVLGIIGWLGIPLDLMSITIASVTIGIGVDDGIHYLHRFRKEIMQRKDYPAVLHRCHNHVGRTAMYTTIIVCTGFSILFLSNFMPTVHFGLLTSVAMIIALLATLIVMPTLLIIFKPFKTTEITEST